MCVKLEVIYDEWGYTMFFGTPLQATGDYRDILYVLHP